MTKFDEWAGILDKDETILWQGRPHTALSLNVTDLYTVATGIGVFAFSVYVVSSKLGEDKLFWFAGHLFLALGVGMILKGVFWRSFVSQYSWYTLTNRSAYIATHLPIFNKSLKSYPITEHSQLELIDGPLPSVNFAIETKRSVDGDYRKIIGFERIPDAKDVYRLMRDIQTKALDRNQNP